MVINSLPVDDLFERCVVMAAEQTLLGSKIDEEALDRLEIDGKATVARLEAELRLAYGVNPGSTDELIEVLQKRGYKFSKRSKSGDKFALDETVLTEMGLTDILAYRKATKLDSAFVSKIKSLLRPGGILPHHQIMMGAETGRTTMRDYNHQQTAKEGPVKGLLISRFEGGYIGNVDQSQSELRCLVYLSSGTEFAKAFASSDPHKYNASLAYSVPYEQVTKPQRSDAKIVVFRAIYGGQPQTPGQKRVRDFYQQQYAVEWAWLKETARLARKQVYITDPYGKTRNLQRILDERGQWAVARAGQNFPIQSVSSHIAMTLLLRCWETFKREGLRSLVLFNVHDSIVFDIHPEELDIVTQIVQDAFRYLNETPIAQFPMFHVLPMTGEFVWGASWAHCEEENEVWKQLVVKPKKILCSSQL